MHVLPTSKFEIMYRYSSLCTGRVVWSSLCTCVCVCNIRSTHICLSIPAVCMLPCRQGDPTSHLSLYPIHHSHKPRYDPHQDRLHQPVWSVHGYTGLENEQVSITWYARALRLLARSFRAFFARDLARLALLYALRLHCSTASAVCCTAVGTHCYTF